MLTEYFLKKEERGLWFRDFVYDHNSQVIKLKEKISTIKTDSIEALEMEGYKIPIVIFKQRKIIRDIYTLEKEDGRIKFEEYTKNHLNNKIHKIKENKLHSVYFEGRGKYFVDQRALGDWLEKCETSPKVVSNLSTLQDRTIFQNLTRTDKGKKVCPVCKCRKATIDHMATKCNKLLDTNYKKIHDAITKLIHFNLTKIYNNNKNKTMAAYKPYSVTEIRMPRYLMKFLSPILKGIPTDRI